MTQPSFVPITEADQVRPARQLKTPEAWSTNRPAELKIPRRPSGPGFGNPGPDQGFALSLAHRMVDRLELTTDESTHDAVAACALVAAKRAGAFGRAPSIYDVTFAFTLWGCLGDAPHDLVAERVAAFGSAAHDYFVQRQVVDRVPEATLRLTPEQVRASLADWRSLLDPAPVATAPG